MTDHMPPNSKEAEKGVIGIMMRDNRFVADVARTLRVDDFYNFGHQRIYEALTELCVTQGKPADVVILADYLNDKELIKDIGNHTYLVDLWDSAPTLGNVEYYVQIIRQAAIVRNLIHVCAEIQKDALDRSLPAEDILGSAEKRILAIAEKGITDNTCTLQEAIDDALQRIDDRKKHGASRGIMSGFLDLDGLTAGFQDGELCIIASRPSIGKTSLAINLIRNIVVEEQKAVLFISLEQSKIEIAERLLCCQARVDSSRVRHNTLNGKELEKMIDASDALGRGKLFIDDTPGQSILRISANARRLKLRHDIKIVIIDYLQLIDPDNRRERREEQVAGISRRLKILARELNIPVITLAQLNRNAEARKDHRPQLADLRESGAIEQDADTVFLLHRPEVYEPGQFPGIFEIIVAKQRNGPIGDISLVFLKQWMRLENSALERAFAS